MNIYKTKKYDVLDWIVWRYYGTTDVLEEVMAENPDVTQEKLDAGIIIKLPYIETIPNKTNEVKLWN